MAAYLGCPFTNAQWKELERQAMIYKYLTASIPVPSYLLIPTPINLNSDSTPRQSCLNLKFTNGAHLEPGRCRRTDGKKWRCSRNVAPDQKYCERHMHIHGARPRSRKPVELQANTDTNNISKKARYDPAYSPVISMNNCVTSQFVGPISPAYLQAPVFLEKTIDKIADFDSLSFASEFNEPRSLEGMLKGVPADQWQCVVEQTEIELSSEKSFNRNAVTNQDYHGREALNPNSFGNFNAGETQQTNQCMFFRDTPEDFIDAWSNGASNVHNATSRNTGYAVSSTGKLSQSSLPLSMDEEMGQNQMELNLIESDQNLALASDSWTGGPLAEVIQLGCANDKNLSISIAPLLL